MLGALKVVLECFADETSGDCATELSEKVSPFFCCFLRLLSGCFL